MSMYGPSSVFLHVGGRDMTGDTMTMEESAESAFEEVHSFGSTWEEQLPVGIGKMTLSAGGGLYNEGVILEALQGVREKKQLVAWGMSGQTIGKEAVIVDGDYVGAWKRVAERNALTKAEGVHTISGVYRRGYILHPMTVETADGDTVGAVAPKGGVDYYDSHLNPEFAVGHIDTTTDYLYGATENPRAIATSNSTTESVICAELFGLKTGDYVKIAGHTGSTPDINGVHKVTVIDAFSFSLDDVANITVGGTGGTFSRITAHGMVTGDKIVISGQTGGTPNLNAAWTITRIDNFRFTLDSVADITVAGTGTLYKRVTSHEFYAHLHVSALSGCASFTATVLDSVDDDTYAPAGAFSAHTLAARTATAATATLSYNASLNATAGRRVHIAGVVYTFVAAVAVEYDVKIGADTDATMLNLSRAINNSGGTNAIAGDYLVRELNGLVSAVHNAGPNTLTLTSRQAGVVGNGHKVLSPYPFDERTLTMPCVFAGGVDEIRTAKIEEADAGTVKLERYAAVSWVFGTPSSPSATFFVGLARR